MGTHTAPTKRRGPAGVLFLDPSGIVSRTHREVRSICAGCAHAFDAAVLRWVGRDRLCPRCRARMEGR